MKLFKFALVAMVLLVNLLFAQPSWADRGKFMKSPDYAEVTQAIATLLQAKDAPDESGLTSEEIQQKMAGLQLQKYILETSEERARCSNKTGKTLGVYLRSKKAPASSPSTLYYLGNGETTDDDFDCNGIYLPTGTNVAFSPLVAAQELTEPLALKIVDGTQFTITSNPESGALEFNIPPAQTIKAGDANWSIPMLAQADIDQLTPNAPED